MSKRYHITWIYHICLYVCQWVDIGWFSLLAAVSNAPVNIYVQAFGWICVFISHGRTPRDGLGGSSGSSVFNCLRNCQTVFQSICTVLCFHQQCMRISVSPRPHRHFLSDFWILAVLIPMKYSSMWSWVALPCWRWCQESCLRAIGIRPWRTVYLVPLSFFSCWESFNF